MSQHNISRRSLFTAGLGLAAGQLLAGVGCAPASEKTPVDALVERQVPGKSVIWQSHAAALEDAAKNGPEGVLDFTAGNPSNPTPEAVKKSVIELLDMPSTKLHAYASPFGDPEVRKQIAKYLSKHYHTTVSYERLVVTAGASQAISLAVGLCCPINAEVALVAPYYTDYTNLVEMMQCKHVDALARISDFQIDIDALSDVISENTYAVIINSPNNPTGAVYTKETLESLADMLRSKSEKFGHPIYLISDEPYRELLFEEAELPYMPDLYDNTLICYSWSKSLALPGERIGYLYISENCADSERILSQVEGICFGTAHLNANATYARAVAKCMGIPVEMAQYSANRKILMQIMDDCGFEYVRPDGAFYLWVKCPNGDDMEFCKQAQTHHLYLAPGTGFGQPGYFRVALCMDTDMYKSSRKAFEALKKDFS